MIAASFLWSPFVCLGLMPFFIYNFIKDIKKYGIKNVINIPLWILIFVIAVILVIYILSNFGSNIGENGIIWKALQLPMKVYIPYTMLFCLLEYVILFLIIIHGKNIFKLDYLLIAFCVLTALVVFKFGRYNDIVMRVSIPAIIVFFIYFFGLLISLFKEKNKIIMAICIVYIIFMSANFFVETKRNLSDTKFGLFVNYTDSMGSLKNFDDEELFNQYISVNYKDSVFYKYFARK